MSDPSQTHPASLGPHSSGFVEPCCGSEQLLTEQPAQMTWHSSAHFSETSESVLIQTVLRLNRRTSYRELADFSSISKTRSVAVFLSNVRQSVCGMMRLRVAVKTGTCATSLLCQQHWEAKRILSEWRGFPHLLINASSTHHVIVTPPKTVLKGRDIRKTEHLL